MTIDFPAGGDFVAEESIMEEGILDAVLGALVRVWRDEEIIVEINGDRLFVRWVETEGENKGWDDWTLVAVYRDGEVVFVHDDKPSWLLKIAEDAKWRPTGYCEPEFGLHIWWARSKLDGPGGPRVSDWASPSGSIGDKDAN